jgi:FkbM family methyltransferase
MPLSEEVDSFNTDVLENLRRLQVRLDHLIMLQRAALLGPEKIFKFLYQDEEITFHLPFVITDQIQRTIFQTNSFFEVNLLEKFRRFVPPSAIILDAGANIGNHTIFFLKICGAKKIFAFEPLRETFRMLLRNVELNGRDRIECFNLALGATQGKASLRRYANVNIGGARLASNAAGRYQLVSLDSFNFEQLDIIKLDVEETEVHVLEGARNTLARCKPTIMVEILPDNGSATDEKLKSLSYRRVEALSDRDFVYQAA